MPTRIASRIMFLALTLMQLVALLAAFFRSAWGHGLAGDAWSGMEGVVWAFELHDEQLQLASSGYQFSKIGHI